MDSMISVTDYHIKITAILTKANPNWWVTPNIPPNYDSDTDYGKMDEFDLDTECSIYNFTIEVRYNCKRMSFEQFLKMIFEIRSHFKQMYKLSYTTTALLFGVCAAHLAYKLIILEGSLRQIKPWSGAIILGESPIFCTWAKKRSTISEYGKTMLA